ncbi:iron complex outermembrane recepter protein [Hymenobacter daecheongensis DSM 21074]|uniref:Iron complex outermembrane recepter protein n=1 Tax=Hymenobacter daecheongensis DSM 21074 TaxID=1121955 RepID=A0A1M6FCA3_9BACT|nr:TonB-dependent receptor [Hymenobacter daecheongensis]SHI95302.1 iron complex outermembrane recepter protein [Hymenobacter daecheongensis DSM 21074]
MLPRIFLLLPALSLLCRLPALAQTTAAPAASAPADTARAVALPEATVVGYGQNLPLRRTAAGVAVLDGRTLDRFSPVSLTAAVNTLPGVRLEERATASYRLSVRGSTLRSPFGVRNVKVYYHDIPFTEASGSTSLNLLDVASLGRIEVVKGPAASVYGAGTGGAVLLSNRQPAPGEARAQAGFTAGSFGLRRYTVAAESGTATSTVRASYAHQAADGYRENSALRREVLTLDGEFRPSAQRIVAAHILYTDLSYQLPGGLTRAQFEQNPRQARPTTVNAAGVVSLGTVAQQAAYASRTALVGVSHEYRFTPRFSNKTTLYTSGTVIRTPFLIDYERNTAVGWGGRTAFGYRAAVAGRALRLSAGGEWQSSFENARNYQNRAGMPGPLRYDDEIRAGTGFGFGQAELELPAGWLATAGLSYNRLSYRIARVSAAAPAPATYDFRRAFRPVVSPRVALLKEITPLISAYASVSTGFSPPTEEEIRPSDGSLNQDLQAERGTSYEVGMRGQLFNNRLTFDVAAYDFRLRQTIVARTTAAGSSLFSNAGTTRQRGLEAALSGWLWQPKAAGGESENAAAIPQGQPQPAGLRAFFSYAYNHYRFGRYESGGNDFSGNRLTGTAPHTLTAGLDFSEFYGFYLSPTLSHQARLPLNDANSEYAAGYWTFGTRAGWRRTLFRHLEADLFAGLDNATDRHYSLGNDLNAFGNRFFQPAPGRNYYGGLLVGWRW